MIHVKGQSKDCSLGGKRENASLLARPMTRRAIFVLWVMGTLPLAAWIMGPSIPNALVVDDYWWLWRLGPEGYSPLGLLPGAGHYSPTIQIILALWYRLFGLDAVPYHLLAIALYWAGAILVALLGWRLTNSEAIGIAAGTGVLINHQPAQAYVWAVGIWYPISTIFFVIGFMAYLNCTSALEKGEPVGKGYSIYLISLVLGILTHEQVLTLVGITLLYTILLVDRIGEKPIGEIYTRPKLMQRVRFFALPLLLTLGAVVARFILFNQGAAQVLPDFPVYEAWLSFMRTFLPGLSRSLALRLSINAGARLTSDATGQIILFLFQLSILVLAFWRANRWYKFLLLWTAAQLITLLYGLGFLFPRHYYLATVPSILLWANGSAELLGWIDRRLTRSRVLVRQFAISGLVGTAGLVLLMTQLPEHRAFQTSWELATETSQRTLQTTKRLAEDNPVSDKLVLLNLPDTLIASNREWIGVFNAGTIEAVNLYMPGRFKSVSVMRTPLDRYPLPGSGLPLNLTQPHLPNLYFGVGEDVSFNQVKSLSEDHTVLVVEFDTAAMNVFQIRYN